MALTECVGERVLIAPMPTRISAIPRIQNICLPKNVNGSGTLNLVNRKSKCGNLGAV